MTEEDNPFMIIPKKPQSEDQGKTIILGTNEEVSFMVTPTEKENLAKGPETVTADKPNWEDAGTPIWDKKNVKNIDDSEYEVVEHNK